MPYFKVTMGLTFGRAEKKVSYGSQKNPHIRISRCKLELDGFIAVFEHNLGCPAHNLVAFLIYIFISIFLSVFPSIDKIKLDQVIFG